MLSVKHVNSIGYKRHPVDVKLNKIIEKIDIDEIIRKFLSNKYVNISFNLYL